MIQPMRALAVLIAAAFVLGALAPAASAAEDSRGKAGKQAKGPKIGSFAESGRAVSGEWISLEWSDAAVRNFTAGGVRLFDLLVTAPATSGPASARVDGAVVKVETPRYVLQAHDNPTAGLKVRAPDGVLTLTLAPGASVNEADEHAHVVFRGGLSARVFGDDDLAIAGNTIRAEGSLRFLLEQPIAPFDTDRPALSRAAAQKKIGVEVSLDEEGRKDVMSYANVTAHVVRTPTEARPELTVLVDGKGFDGRVVVLNVDGKHFGPDAASRLAVLFDNVTMRAAEGGLADALDPDDDGLHPEYWLGIDAATGGFQLVVSVPHYSVHEIRVQSILAEAPVSIVLGVAAAVVAVAASAFALFRRPS